MDRLLSEQNRRGLQEMQRVRNELRALAKRVRWPGAVRQTRPPDLAQTTSTSWSVLDLLHLDPGRWMVIGRAVVHVDTDATDDEDDAFELILEHAPYIDVPVGNTGTIDDRCALQLPYTSVAARDVKAPLTCFASILVDVRSTVWMSGQAQTVGGGVAHSASWIDQVLIALPF